MYSSVQVARDARAVLDTELAREKQATTAMQERLVALMEEAAAAKGQAKTERAKQDLVQAKLEEQISVLKTRLEEEATKLLTSEQELSSSTRRELELKKQFFFA